jgi:hypothetical protein
MMGDEGDSPSYNKKEIEEKISMLEKRISNTIGKSAHKLLETKIMIAVILLITLTTASLTYLPIYAATPPEPTYGTADVNGDDSEWAIPGDFFSDMYRAGNPANVPILAKLYLRYDCTNNILYVLVQTESGVILDLSKTDEHWVEIDGTKKVNDLSGDDGTPPDFAFVPTSGPPYTGWEASISLLPGTYTLEVHSNVIDAAGNQQTSDTDRAGIDLFICCGGQTITTTFTDCTTTIATSWTTSYISDCTTTVATSWTTETISDCTTTVATSWTTDTISDCTTTIATTTIATTEECYTGEGGVSNFGKIQCEGPDVIVGGTSEIDLWTKPTGTVFAQFIDSTAAALMWGLCVDGLLHWDIDPTVVNQATGATIGTGHEILSGGPLVNGPVKYYEGNRDAPVYYKRQDGKANFFEYNPSGPDILLSAASLAHADITHHKDVFVVEVFMKPGTEADPEYVAIAYGYKQRGTLAAAVWFKTIVEPNLSSYTADYYIVMWDDNVTTPNAHPDVPDTIPGGQDTYTVLYPP